MDNLKIEEQIKGGLIVSCQALEDEPLFSSFIMARMAYAAKLGGASGIRANTVKDISAIKAAVDLPIIGIIKEVYGDNNVYITPTMVEIDALAKEGVEIIAIDATKRERPDGKSLEELFLEAKAKYPNQLFMADVSDYEEGIFASKLGFDFIGTTLSGYTEYTKGTKLPNIDLMEKLCHDTDKKIVAEGGIWSPEDLEKAYKTPIHTAVVGSAITRPMEITKKYVAKAKK